MKLLLGIVTAIAWLALCWLTPTEAATITLEPPPEAYTTDLVLLQSCGGRHISTYVTGFDFEGNITGELYAWTKCSTGGRGTKPKLFSSWHSIRWSLYGLSLGVVAWDGTIPDTTFTATDGTNDISTISYYRPYGTEYRGLLVMPDPVVVDVPPADGDCSGACHQ